jgi:hypothetical protein
MGQADLAEYTRQESAPDALVRARKLAVEGSERYPRSPGGKRCLSIYRSIEAADFQIAAMKLDGPKRRSIEITHKNLPALYLRAYTDTIERRLRAISGKSSCFTSWRLRNHVLHNIQAASANDVSDNF